MPLSIGRSLFLCACMCVVLQLVDHVVHFHSGGMLFRELITVLLQPISGLNQFATDAATTWAEKKEIFLKVFQHFDRTGMKLVLERSLVLCSREVRN
ncbi:hypothetical protein CDAR_184211 [Caerostris darwini]|uniref:Secreted protein n=1 Tax=Caerostris darwini TaxID=1538125 RepID=A0AAV4VYM3_9ARAC|nr:hypothetical protein CDAR_184211 [Caerostris darwini]